MPVSLPQEQSANPADPPSFILQPSRLRPSRGLAAPPPPLRGPRPVLPPRPLLTKVFREVKDEFVPLKAAYLRRFFPSNEVYKQVRDALLESRTVICDGVCYQADSLTWRNHNDRHRWGKCFGYKLGPRWEGVRHERVTVTTKPLLKSIAKVNKVRESESSLCLTGTSGLVSRTSRSITPAAVQELDALMVGASPEEIDGYTGQHVICDGIHNGDWLWHVCHFGRVYNNVTGLEVVEALSTG